MTTKQSLLIKIITPFFLLITINTTFAEEVKLAGIKEAVTISYDSEGKAHIIASHDLDAAFALGYVHATDRLFQMDVVRRSASGSLAELVGSSVLSSDIQIRTLGLRRAAYETYFAMDEDMIAYLQAYANGVNAYIANHSLPLEYAALEVTQFNPWSAVDCIVVGKALAFELSFDLDIQNTLNLIAYQTAGAAIGFDGTALFAEDTHRVAPTDGRVSMPEFFSNNNILGKSLTAQKNQPQLKSDTLSIDPNIIKLAKSYKDKIADIPFIANKLDPRDGRGGSNLWAVSANYSESGKPLVANDPHLGLPIPATFVEAHLISTDPTYELPMNTSGVSVPGTPGVIQGCTQHLCWGSTVHPIDVTDTFQEQLLLNSYGLPTHTIYKGEPEPIIYVFQSYYVNNLGDGIMDNSSKANVGYDEGGITFLIPRRNNGPILDFDPETSTALSVQYTGWGPTFELLAFRKINRANNMADFQNALTYFDFGSQNFVYADLDGNVAHFTGAEVPLRTDLQTLQTADGGIPPWIIRDGTGTLAHEWMLATDYQQNQATPFQLLPIEELPTQINPARGYVLNANNDNVGSTLDNNALNQLRSNGGIYYLDWSYSDFRMGRLDRELANLTANGGKVSITDMKALQANNQMLDAELVAPFILQAYDNAMQDGAWNQLVSIANLSNVEMVIELFKQWDFSTPTGITAGFDPGDDPLALPEPNEQEKMHSAAATIFSTWRGQVLRDVVDDTLHDVGLSGYLPSSKLAYTAFINTLQNFDNNKGFGASGIDFYYVPDAPDRESARDFVLLNNLRKALNLLASDEFAPAFQNSVSPYDYTWGKLHRIVFDHPLGDPFNVPNAGGFSDLSPELPGIARSGGYQVLDASSHSPRANSLNGFMFGGGPARRFVATMDSELGIQGEQILPGGQSGVITSPYYTNQLGRWLTNDYHPLFIEQEDVLVDQISELMLLPQ